MARTWPLAAAGCQVTIGALRVKMRAVCRISVSAGGRVLPGSRCPACRSRAGAAGRATTRPRLAGLRLIRGLAWGHKAGGQPGRARVARGAGAPRLEGSFRDMRWWHRFLSRRRPQAQGRACPGRSVRPDLTARAKPSVDAAGPGRQASGTCSPAEYPATADAGGSAPTTTARDLRRPPGHPCLPRGITRPGGLGGRVGRCLPRQAGRTVTRQAARQPRPAGAPAGPDQAAGAGQWRNVPGGGCPD
jgi:hypothetical protein